MTSDRITAALREASDTRTVAIVAGRLAFVDDVFAESFGNVPAVVIADENTWDAAGRVVEERLRTAGRSLEARTIFPRRPPLRTEYEVIERLRDSLNAHRAIPVAVGAGPVNDVVKRAAHEAGGPYMVVATAASMDGYASFGATVVKDGFKQTPELPRRAGRPRRPRRARARPPA